MIQRWAAVLGMIAALLATPAAAVKVTSLYTAEVAVPTQAADVRAEAIRKGFLDVLMRVSGNPDVASAPGIKAGLSKAEYYVQEYSYSAATVDSATVTLKVTFDEDDVNRLLKNAGVVYWGDTRPLVMLWMAVTDSDHQTVIIGGDDATAVMESVKAEGKRVGLPLILPVMDVDDMNQVTPATITSVALPALTQASARYAPDAILVANIEPLAPGFTSHWLLILKDKQWAFTIPGTSLQTIISTAMHQVSQTLATRYMEKPTQTESHWINLVVNQVSADHDLEQIMAYLKQLSPVQQVQLTQVDGETVTLRVLISGSLDTFEQNASIGQKLVFLGQDDTTQTVTYNWMH